MSDHLPPVDPLLEESVARKLHEALSELGDVVAGDPEGFGVDVEGAAEHAQQLVAEALTELRGGRRT